jgi:DNA-binding IclR family transcriptional regulator
VGALSDQFPNHLSNTSSVGAVANAAKILHYLGAARAPLRLTQISRPLGINTSTCLNILRTLADQRLVRADRTAKTYSLGRGIVELARDALNYGENLGEIRPAMEDLAQRHGVTVMLWGRVDAEDLILLAIASGEPLRSIHAEVGLRVPLLSGSMGRLFAGDIDLIALHRLFCGIAWKKPMDLDSYLDEVYQAANRGWALDAGYYDSAIWGLSAPASPAGGPVDRVVSVALLANQHEQAIVEKIAKDLIAVGRR